MVNTKIWESTIPIITNNFLLVFNTKVQWIDQILMHYLLKLKRCHTNMELVKYDVLPFQIHHHSQLYYIEILVEFIYILTCVYIFFAFCYIINNRRILRVWKGPFHMP
jgi:hypothetical protein